MSEIKKITKKVDMDFYIAPDGSEFKSKDACQHYIDKLNGNVRTCPCCNGTGEIPDGYGMRNITCPDCSGKGWQRRFVETKWM